VLPAKAGIKAGKGTKFGVNKPGEFQQSFNYRDSKGKRLVKPVVKH
jgi:hypothetical protein